METLFQAIENSEQEYLQLCVAACNLESPTEKIEAVNACGRFFAEFAIRKGWGVELFPMVGAADVVCITMNAEAKGAPIVLSGHIDTVHPIGSFGTPAVRIEGDKMIGPGVTDCKGGIVAGLMAMDALQQVGFTARPVKMLLQTDEEVSSRFSKQATIRCICEQAKDAEAFLNLEGCGSGRACICRKGIARYCFTVKGQEAHASKCFEEGANAIAEAAHLILRLEQLKDGEGITCNCGIIRGGTATNTVPKECVVDVDFRYVNQAQLETVRNIIKDLEAHPQIEGCSITACEVSLRLPMERVERNERLLARMNEIYASCGLPVLDGSQMRTGGSDAADVTAFGIPCVDSIGVLGGKIHSPEEFVWLDSFEAAAKRLAAVIYKL